MSRLVSSSLARVAMLAAAMLVSETAAGSPFANVAHDHSTNDPSGLLHLVQRRYRDPNMSNCVSDQVSSQQSIAACSRAINAGRLDNLGFSDAYFARGYEYARTGEPDRAMDDFTKSIEYSPDAKNAFFNRAYLHLLKRNYKAVLADAEKTVQYDRNIGDGWVLRWIARAALGQGQQVLPEVENYVKKYYSAESYFARAEVLRLLGRPEDAIYDYVAVLSDQKVESRMRLAVELSLREMVSRPEPKTDVRPEPKPDPRPDVKPDAEPQADHRDRNACEDSAGAAAIAACTRAIDSKRYAGEELAELMQIRGFERFRAGDMNGAAADFSEVIKIIPKAVFAHEYRGHAYVRLGRSAEAKADYERALTNTSDQQDKKRLEETLRTLAAR